MLTRPRAIRLVLSGLSLTLAAGLAAAADPPNTLTAAEKQAGWALLFNGENTDGWRGYKKPDTAGLRWIVKDGLLCLPPADGADTRGHRDIISAGQYDDFDLRWEWRVNEGSNSGVKYFVLEEGNAAIGHEYQIIDDERHKDAQVGPDRRTAAFYDVFPAQAARPKPAGGWNQSRVLVHGNHVEHWLNGDKVLEYELGGEATLKAVREQSKFKDTPGFGTKKRGHILLQDHGDEVCYRNVKIKAGGSGTH